MFWFRDLIRVNSEEWDPFVMCSLQCVSRLFGVDLWLFHNIQRADLVQLLLFCEPLFLFLGFFQLDAGLHILLFSSVVRSYLLLLIK